MTDQNLLKHLSKKYPDVKSATEEIVNLQAKGAVKIDGKTWTARSVKEDTVISQGSIVLVREIEGVKLLVELPSEAEQEGTAEGPAPSEQ